MAKRNKTVEIDSKKYTVYELSPRQIREILDAAGAIDTASAEQMLGMAADISMEEIAELGFSEIRVLWDAFSEVNSDFLSLVKKALNSPAVQRAIEGLIERASIDVFAALSKGDMPAPGITGTDSSWPA